MQNEDGVSPAGQIDSSCRTMIDKGVSTGVTDRYDSNLEKGYNKVSSGTACTSDKSPRMENC